MAFFNMVKAGFEESANRERPSRSKNELTILENVGLRTQLNNLVGCYHCVFAGCSIPLLLIPDTTSSATGALDATDDVSIFHGKVILGNSIMYGESTGMETLWLGCF